jgi:hypothetical protein
MKIYFPEWFRGKGASAFLLLLIPLAMLSTLPHLTKAAQVETASAALATRVGPGDTLPVQVKLSNFGSNKRVDVSIQYLVLDANNQVIVNQSEVVAVETTASFIHNLALPSTIHSGTYIARTNVTYSGQEAPAFATYQFTVEQKFAGVFVTDLYIYVGIVLLLLILIAFLIFALRRRRGTETAFTYENIPHEQRIYYQIIGDMIHQMRLEVGVAAIEMAVVIPGLVLDRSTGRIVALREDPPTMIAQLVAQYESQFGRKMNFSLGSTAATRAIVRSK